MKRNGRIYETRFEVRDDGDGPLIVGHGAVFNSPSLDLGGFREIVDAKAFSKTLRENKDIMSFFNHDANHVLGRTSAKTLRVSVDDEGLAYEVRPPETSWAADLMVSIRRGDIRGSSFMFDVVKDTWGQSDDGQVVRTLKEVRLYELGPVTFPAYPAADSAVRSIYSEWGEESGVDFAALAGLLARARGGVPLTDDDRRFLDAAVDTMRGILPAAEPASNPPRVGQSFDSQRRRLRLAEVA